MEVFSIMDMGRGIILFSLLFFIPLLVGVGIAMTPKRPFISRLLGLLFYAVPVPVFAIWFFYHGFGSLKVGKGMVEMRYLWPRPMARVDAALLGEIIHDYRSKVRRWGGYKIHWLKVEVNGSNHVSMSDDSRLIERMQFRLMEEKYRRFLEILEKSYGLEHPDVAEAMELLGMVFADQKRHAEAETLYQKAFSIKENAFGPDDPKIFPLALKLAVFYRNREDYDKAEIFLQRALDVLQKHSNFEIGKADHSELMEYCESLHSFIKRRGGKDLNPTPATALTPTADTEMKTQQAEAERQLAQRVKKLLEKK